MTHHVDDGDDGRDIEELIEHIQSRLADIKAHRESADVHAARLKEIQTRQAAIQTRISKDLAKGHPIAALREEIRRDLKGLSDSLESFILRVESQS